MNKSKGREARELAVEREWTVEVHPDKAYAPERITARAALEQENGGEVKFVASVASLFGAVPASSIGNVNRALMTAADWALEQERDLRARWRTP